jgi:hypothetical protein
LLNSFDSTTSGLRLFSVPQLSVSEKKGRLKMTKELIFSPEEITSISVICSAPKCGAETVLNISQSTTDKVMLHPLLACSVCGKQLITETPSPLVAYLSAIGGLKKTPGKFRFRLSEVCP